MVESTEKIVLKPIGVVHTNASDKQVKEEHRKIEATVEVFPKFKEALQGLDGYSHLFIMSYLHKLRPEQIGPLKVKPRRATKRGFKLEELPTLGVFALDSPTRPNPIGLTLVRLLKRQDGRLFISGIDLFDGTPVIDIKAYQPDYEAKKYSMPEWYLKIMSKNGHV
ncbi:tRNA (N6-threonylcarbamoyladenosine(37)-N6)-methyltransferase TrmO [Candidatus Bathyarchaeota archaeon]|nr:tRNA (N6-threonylcarbamoyladenosine(37)-N6)-methyltransferase TrmO [Candidatus Bathyarchaeota archaeon]